MTNRKQAARQRGIGGLVLAILVALPTAPAADDARALQYLGQGLQRMAEDQRRREQQQERLRLQQEQLELQRQKMQAAEKERQQAQQQVREAEQRALQGERATRAEAEKTKRVEEQTPPEMYAKSIAIHRSALTAIDSSSACQAASCGSATPKRPRDNTDSRSLILDRLSESPEHVALLDYLKLTTKDPFETTEAWRKRVASLSLSHRISLDLDQYDADQGRFEARFRSIPMNLPLPPQVARSLANAKTVDLEGDLKVLDANFFELTNPKVLLPDGRTHTIVAKACPKTLAEVMPGLRAFQSPRLATLRRQILESSIPATLEKARKAGFDRQAAIAATNEQFDRYTNDAERIYATKDAAVAAELLNLDKLPLGYTCHGPKGESVCRYIEHMWRAMAAYAMTEAMSCR